MSEHKEIQMYDSPLTIKDHLPYSYILTMELLTHMKSVLAEEHSEREIEESIMSLVSSITDDWKDEQFLKDKEAATKTKKVDVRPQITGVIKMTEKTCLKLGIKAYKKVTVTDYFALKQACYNLFNRRKLLSNILRVEKLEGIELESNLEKDEVWKSDLFSEQE